MSTQNVNEARFARIVEWDFFCDFQTHIAIYLQVKNQYVEASNFRQTTTATTENITEVNIPVNPLPQPPTTPFAFQPEGLGQEFDKAYFATLDAFVHDF